MICGVDAVQGGGLRIRGDLRICFLLACLLCMLSVQRFACVNCTFCCTGQLLHGRNVQEFEGFDSLDGVLYDAACKHCWKQGVLEADNADGSSASESTDDSLASD